MFGLITDARRLAGDVSDLADQASEVAADALGNMTNRNIWMITDSDGQIVLEFSSFLSADVRNEGQVVSAPVEEGGFASYNKVDSPLAVAASLAFQGTEEQIQDAIFMLSVLREETLLVNLVTPDAEYENLTLESYSYRRDRESGVGVLFVELSFVEVRQVATQYTNVRLAPRKQRGLQRAQETSFIQGGADYVTGGA